MKPTLILTALVLLLVSSWAWFRFGSRDGLEVELPTCLNGAIARTLDWPDWPEAKHVHYVYMLGSWQAHLSGSLRKEFTIHPGDGYALQYHGPIFSNDN